MFYTFTSLQNEYFRAFKQARRRDDDIAIVNAAMRVAVEEATVVSATLSFGGVAAKSVVATKTCQVS